MILVTGCSGFVGTHLVNGLVREGFDVKCLVRGTSKRDRLPGDRITFAVGDVTDRDSVLRAVEGVDTVIHLVGIIREKGQATFERIHVEGTRNTIEAAKAHGIRRFIYQSALGAKPDGLTDYQTTKWQAEELTKASGMAWIITRPSIIIGRWGEFVDILTGLVKKPPIIPVIGSGEYKLQPLYIGDLVQAFVKMLRDESLWGTTYEFGGPDQLTFNQMLDIAQEVLGVRKRKIHLPVSLMKPVVRLMETASSKTPVTSDELAMMAEDNVTDHNALTAVFGIEPTLFREALRLSI